MTTDSNYVLGHGDLEMARLKLQAAILRDITARLIGRSGIAPGMRVLDIGCGAGDVSMLLAEIVGQDGRVVAIDREARAIETARLRAAAEGYGNIDFVLSQNDDLGEAQSFDAAIGRYVLVHQPDPAAFVRRAVAVVRRGGIVAFHEPVLYSASESWPTVELCERLDIAIRSAFRNMLTSYDIGGRMITCFHNAGLPTPRMLWESVVEDGSADILAWGAMTYRSMLPHIERLGLDRADDGDARTIYERLRAAATAAGAQIVSRPQACAWSRVP